MKIAKFRSWFVMFWMKTLDGVRVFKIDVNMNPSVFAQLEGKVDTHFIAFVEAGGQLFEMDGRKQCHTDFSKLLR